MLNHTEIETQLQRRSERRYEYFVRSVVADEEVFGLADDEGWSLLGEEGDGADVIPVFPYPEFAERFKAVAGFDDNHVEVLDLAEFMEWLDDFEAKKMKVAVFPNLGFEAVVIEPARLRADLQAEMDKEKGE